MKIPLSIVLVLLLSLSFPGSMSADYSRGFIAYSLEDYATALEEFRAAAEQGDPRAQFSLGVMYGFGSGVPQNYAEALRWYRKAAEQGHADAQFNLGGIYGYGSGVPQNYAEALRWYRKAAEQGHADAQFNLGVMYRFGKGVPQNYAEALRWYRKAAEQGHAMAQFNLGVMYFFGRGVPQNYAEALRWYHKAAEQGHADAQFNLGLMYDKGQGVARNYVLSYKWASLAAALSNETARRNLQIVERKMTREQIAEAQRLAAAFRPRVEMPGITPTPQDTSFSVVAAATPPRETARSESTPSVSTIRRIQSLLSQLGYDLGQADGIMGPRTRRAIQAFQRDAGIDPDGIASSTLAALLAAMVDELREGSPTTSHTQSISLDSTGTAFFVSKSGHLLTNYHVIEGCRQIKVVLPDGPAQARLDGVHPDDDLALLRVDAQPDAVAVFRRAAAEIGEDVQAVGYPLRGVLGGINVTSGTVSATSGIQGDRRYLQVTTPVQPGNSGGPLLDTTGAVVGVVVGKLDTLAVARATGDIPQNVNFAIKGPVARSFLSIHDIEYLDATRHSAPGRVAVAAEAQKYTFMVECWK